MAEMYFAHCGLSSTAVTVQNVSHTPLQIASYPKRACQRSPISRIQFQLSCLQKVGAKWSQSMSKYFVPAKRYRSNSKCFAPKTRVRNALHTVFQVVNFSKRRNIMRRRRRQHVVLIYVSRQTSAPRSSRMEHTLRWPDISPPVTKQASRYGFTKVQLQQATDCDRRNIWEKTNILPRVALERKAVRTKKKNGRNSWT